MVNAGGRRVFVERDRALECVRDVVLDEHHLAVAIKNIARTCGDEISDVQPVLDARLEDGSRVTAMFPPCAVDGATLTIRKFTLRTGRSRAHRHAHADVSYRPARGRTRPPEHPVLRRNRHGEDDAVERRWVSSPHLPRVTIADLVRATLRHRPDRVIVGEVRGSEAFDLLQALNTGHLGSLSTIHPNNARQALIRFEHCLLIANVGLPHASVRDAICAAFQLVAHIARDRGRRQVTELLVV
jgi:pilus assembly protein CpaF